MLAVWALLLCRHSGQDEVVIGAPHDGRNVPGTQQLVGYFVNVLALRIDMPKGCPITRVLSTARDVTVDGMRHGALHFQQVVLELLPRRVHDASRNAVFQTMLAWAPEGGWMAGQSDTMGAGIEISPVQLRSALPVAKFEVTYHAHKTVGGGVDGSIEFNTDLFERGSIERLAARLVVLAAALVGAPAEADVWSLPLMLSLIHI